MRHRTNEFRPRNVILRQPPLLHTFTHGWTDLGLLRETHFTNPNGRENTYYPEAIHEWLVGRRADVVFLGRGTQKFLRMDTTHERGVVG